MPSARRTWLLLGALTAAGAALRLPFLGLQSIWYDETFTLAIAQQDGLGLLWDQVRLTESTPALYYIVTWAWTELVGSTGDAALRTPAAVAGVLGVPAAYLGVRRFVGERAALGAAALTAVSPVLISYSLNARAYPLLVLFACLSLWAMGEALARGGWGRLAVWAVFAAACLWTHYYAVFLVAAELGVLLWRMPGARLRVMGAAAAVGVMCLPLLRLLPDQRDERASHIESLDLADRVEQAVRQMAAGPNPPFRGLEWLAVALGAGGLAVGAWLAVRGRGVAAEPARRAEPLRGGPAEPLGAREPLRDGPALLAAVGAAAVLLPLLLDLVGVDNHFFMRNLLVAWAALAGLAALALTRARALPLALTLAVFAALAIGTHADWHHQNADWEGAVETLGTDADGLPVVALPGFDAPVAARYLDRVIAIDPVVAQSAWVMVSPGRPGQPDLEETRGVPRAAPPGFRPTATRAHRGFKMILLEAERPTPLDPNALGPDQIGQPPVLLPPR